MVGLGTNLGGERSLVTQGDSNDIPDAEPVQPVQVKGKLWYSVPYLGYVNNVVGGDERGPGYVAVAGLLGYAAFMFVERRPRPAPPPAGRGRPTASTTSPLSERRSPTCSAALCWIVLVSAVLTAGAGAARANDEVGLSLDGQTWTSELGVPLRPAHALVPGDIETRSFWVRNRDRPRPR